MTVFHARSVAEDVLVTDQAAEALDAASDLRQDGAKSKSTGKPIVALVSASDCSYCELVKKNVLVGMETDERIILRELGIDTNLALVDFEGNRTTHRDFARSRGLSFTPTVLFLDSAGSPLAAPLVGVTTIDFYGFYLDRGITQSIEALKQQSRPATH